MPTNLKFECGFDAELADNAYALRSGAAAYWMRSQPELLQHLPPLIDPAADDQTDLNSVDLDATPRSSVVDSECSMAVKAEKTARRGLSLSITDERKTPSLSSGGTTVDCSLALSRAHEVLTNGGPIDDEGMLSSPLRSIQCEFWFLGCTRTFEFVDFQAWHEHCRSHLGPHEPPRLVSCPVLGCPWTEKKACGESAWLCRQQHIEESHVLEAMHQWKPRVDSVLLTHLWNHNRVDDIQRRVLIMEGCRRVVPAAFVQSHGECSAGNRRNRPARHGRS